MLVERAFAEPGFRAVCIREVQKDLGESAKRLIEDKIKDYGLGESFDCQRGQIVTPGGGVIIFEGMQDHNAESIKSLEGFDVAWVEEAQTLSVSSLTMLRPTIRKSGSELWFSWNPRRKTDAVDDFFRGPAGAPTRSSVVRANWSDNPWFPLELAEERKEDLDKRPDHCDHIWDGGYATVLSGAYYAKLLMEAKAQGRIGNLGADPLMTIRLFCDIGGAGKKSDAFSIWAAQFIGREIRVLNYYEAVGQPIGHHLIWMRENKYTPGTAAIWLPHDGDNAEKIIDWNYKAAFEQHGYEVEIIPNQGTGAAKMRIEAGRRLFPTIWFNEKTTEPGRDALGWYHEKKDEARNVGLGPEHDWASHGADAFGLMCVAYEAPKDKKPMPKRNMSWVV
jgi:phage terminase large subunit